MDWERYDEKFYRKPNTVSRMENQFFENLLKQNNLMNNKCLDFGCGQGYWSERLALHGAHVVAVDASRKALANCKQCRSQTDYCLIQSGKIPKKYTDFDIVICCWVFQEICDDGDFLHVLSEVRRVLRDDGKLIIAENVYPDSRKLIRASNLGDIFENHSTHPTSLRFFRDNSLSAILKKQFKLLFTKKVGDSFFEIYQPIRK